MPDGFFDDENEGREKLANIQPTPMDTSTTMETEGGFSNHYSINYTV